MYMYKIACLLRSGYSGGSNSTATISKEYRRAVGFCHWVLPLRSRLGCSRVQWPISETNITCDSVTSFGGQIMEKTVSF